MARSKYLDVRRPREQNTGRITSDHFANPGNAVTRTVSMTEFRRQLNALWPDVAAGKIRYVVTYRGRPAFVMRQVSQGGLRSAGTAR